MPDRSDAGGCSQPGRQAYPSTDALGPCSVVGEGHQGWLLVDQCRTTLSYFKQNVTEGKAQVIRSVVAVADSYAMLGRPEDIVPRLARLIEERVARTPWCPACQKPMHLVSANSDNTYAKLRHVVFVCDCGRASDQLVQV